MRDINYSSTKKSRVRIILVDDHIILRSGLRSLICNHSQYEVVGEARNGIEAIDLITTTDVDIVLMDIVMPEMNGIDCTRAIKNLNPEIQVIAVTMHTELPYINEMILAGAKGYILKSASQTVVEEAIEAVVSGGKYYGSELKSVIESQIPEREVKKDLVNTLSKREIDILRLIIQEKSNKEIAESLFISIRTVDAHRRNLLKKTFSKNNVGLTKYALSHQLI